MAMNDYYQNYTAAIHRSLEGAEATNAAGEKMDNQAWIEAIAGISAEAARKGGRIFFAGNGASAAFASHMALDWNKNGGIPSFALNDAVQLTALGNDLGYDEVFAAPIEWHGKPADLLATISSSGNSPNIVRAIEKAREAGMKVVTFSGLKPDNRSRSMGDLNIYVPAKTYGVVECVHQVLLHAWLDLSMGIEEWARESTQNMRAGEFRL